MQDRSFLQPRLKNGWFAEKKPKMLVKRKSIELAELFGILLGDGNCQVIKSRGIYQIRIFGHSIDDKNYLSKYVKRLLKRTFNVEFSVTFKKKCKAIMLSKQSKDLVYTLKKFGLNDGNKTKNNAKIPDWIFQNKKYLKACIRGLIDTDGCVYPKTRKHKTPTIWFTSASKSIRKSFTKAFKILGYKVSKWVDRKNKNVKQCSMGNSKEVLKYYKEVGFSNPKYEKRFKKFWNAPMV